MAQALPNQKASPSTANSDVVKPHVFTGKKNQAENDKVPETTLPVKSAVITSQSRPPQSKTTNGNLASKAGSNLPKEKSTGSPAQPSKSASAPIPKPTPKLKEFTGDELLAKEFVCLPFTGKFLELIGSPSKLFAGLIWGLPKGGKSNFCIRFADYLQEYFGKVVYIAAEEGESVTLQEKFKDIGGSKVTVVETRDRDVIRDYLPAKKCDFVFIDSINNAGIDNEFLELLKTENPTKSFIGIVQATKGGNFKGDQALTHNCDFIIKVVDGIAYHQGRFNVASEISIFEEPLYEKNAEGWAENHPATAESGELNSIDKDVTSVANVGTGAVCEHPEGTGKATQHIIEGIQNPSVQVATSTESSLNSQSSIILASDGRGKSIFGPPSLVTALPVKATPLNLPVSSDSSKYSSYTGSSLGSSTPGYYSTSVSDTPKTKKGKKKGGSDGRGIGTALLFIGGGFIGGCIYVEMRNQATERKAKAAAALKARLSPTPSGKINQAAVQQPKALPPAARANQPAAVPAQLKQVPDRRMAVRQPQRNIQQPQPDTRPRHSAQATMKTPQPIEPSDEVWWGLDGLDKIL